MVISQTRHFSLSCATKEETGLERFKDLTLVNQVSLAEVRAGRHLLPVTMPPLPGSGLSSTAEAGLTRPPSQPHLLVFLTLCSWSHAGILVFWANTRYLLWGIWHGFLLVRASVPFCTRGTPLGPSLSPPHFYTIQQWGDTDDFEASMFL